MTPLTIEKIKSGQRCQKIYISLTIIIIIVIPSIQIYVPTLLITDPIFVKKESRMVQRLNSLFDFLVVLSMVLKQDSRPSKRKLSQPTGHSLGLTILSVT